MISKSLDLTGQSLWKYPLASDTIDESDINSLIDWLRTNPRLTMGEVTKQFEHKWSDFIGTNYSVYLNSGSSANLLMVYSLLNAGKLKNNKFLEDTRNRNADGAIACYKGFHPHMLGTDNYAFLKETDSSSRWMEKIQEKKPFTNSPRDEFASSGTYYFKTGDLISFLSLYFTKSKNTSHVFVLEL